MSPSARQPPPNVCAVVVTYGRRGMLCRLAVESALEAGAASVVIVDNGTGAATRNEFAEWAERRANVTIVELGANTGSACGFGRGIEAALAKGADYVWLLDDDSDVEAAALVELTDEAVRRQDAGQSRFALVSLRPDLSPWQQLADGGRVDDCYPSHSSFLGFNIRDFLRRLGRRPRPLVPAPRLVEGLPYAAYGGLLLPRRLVEEIGLPDERLVVYEDDTEYTHRVHGTGGVLILVTGSRVFDREAPWYSSSPGRWPQEFLVTAASDARVYYSIRNAVYFETTRWGGRKALYMLNKVVLLAFISAAAIKDWRLRRLRLILAAVRDGETEKLGRRVELEGNL